MNGQDTWEVMFPGGPKSRIPGVMPYFVNVNEVEARRPCHLETGATPPNKRSKSALEILYQSCRSAHQKVQYLVNAHPVSMGRYNLTAYTLA